MKITTSKTVRRVIGPLAAGLLGALTTATMAAPTASAAADCSPDALNATVSSTTGSARAYLSAHPDANAVVSAAAVQPRPEASANVRAYFTAHPQEYFELRGILAPIGDAQNQCNVTLLSPDLASAYTEFMSG
jgi:hemophore-related protein